MRRSASVPAVLVTLSLVVAACSAAGTAETAAPSAAPPAVESAAPSAAPTEAQAEIGQVLSHLELLSFRQRRAIQMRYIGGMGFEEVGHRLGVTRQRAKQLCNEGIRSLRQIFCVGDN